MSEPTTRVLFEAWIAVDTEKIDTYVAQTMSVDDAKLQAVQDEIGHTGAQVVSVGR